MCWTEEKSDRWHCQTAQCVSSFEGQAMYRNILVETDGSDLSNHPIEYDVALAKAVNSN